MTAAPGGEGDAPQNAVISRSWHKMSFRNRAAFPSLSDRRGLQCTVKLNQIIRPNNEIDFRPWLGPRTQIQSAQPLATRSQIGTAGGPPALRYSESAGA